MSSEGVKKPVSSKYGEILAIIAKSPFEEGIALERQIASHLRELILDQKLAAKTRLPPILILAEAWGTNYYTVRAALHRLAGEGLLVQSPKLGTFVAPARKRLQRVCLYHDHPISPAKAGLFYSRLNVTLYLLLSARGIVTTSYFDQRKGAARKAVPPEILELVRDRRVDAIIGSSIGMENPEWRRQLTLPVVSLSQREPHCSIALDYNGFIEAALQEALKAKRKRIGLIHRAIFPKPDFPGAFDLETEFRKAAERYRLEVIVPDGTEEAYKRESLEEGGMRLCEELLQRRERPDALIVFPDEYARGVIYSLLQNHIKLPEEMILISHRNAETQIFSDFPVTWLTVKIEDFAEAMIQQAEAKLEGKPISPVLVRFSVERSEKR